jgi:non-ribosomal peptide synthetase component F
LRDLGRQEQVTLYVVLLTAFAILLYRYSGQVDIVVGSPLANRSRHEFENVMGFFVNTMPLRIDLRGNPTFSELLQRAQRVTLGASEHEDLPLARLVGELGPERRLNRNPLFQVEFALLTPDHNPASYGYGLDSPVQYRHRLGELTVTPQDVEGGVARFDIAVFLWDLPHTVSGVIEYSAELFDQPTIRNVIAGFESLLSRAAAAPDSTVDSLVEHVRKTDRIRDESAGVVYNQASRRRLMEGKRGAARSRGKKDGHEG